MATRKDVAEHALVSPSTVSRVVNNNGYVAPEVRKRVEQAIRDLGYVPNRIARSLRSQSSMQIACVTHNITNPFYGEVVLGLEEEAFSNGYSFSLYNSNFDQRDYPRLIQEGFHDGLIILSPVELLRGEELEKLRNLVPIVLYWDWAGEAPVPNVTINLGDAMELAVTSLIQLGHREIIYLGYESDEINENPRFLGYQTALRKHGLPVRRELIQLIPKWQDTLANGYQKIQQFITQRQSISYTAVAASNDLLAIGAIRALKDAGKSVPEDVSVTGIDDIELAQMIVPSLTTVHIPKVELGQSLFQLWQSNINDADQWTRSLTSKIRLISRESATSIN